MFAETLMFCVVNHPFGAEIIPETQYHYSGAQTMARKHLLQKRAGEDEAPGTHFQAMDEFCNRGPDKFKMPILRQFDTGEFL